MTAVSVVIPCYNHAAYLPDAINSVLRQTEPAAEIIVVDDGSTDDTAAVAAAFGPAISYLFQKNRGLSAARNTGLALASGEAVVFLDADDLLEPDYIAVMAGALGDDPSAAAVYCGFRMVDPANRPLPQTGLRPLPPSALYAALLDGNFIVPPCMTLRRAVLEVIGPFDPSIRDCEDWDLWIRLSSQFQVASVDSILVRYRLTPGSMSSKRERVLAGRLVVIERHLSLRAQATLSIGNRPFSRAYLTSVYESIQAHDEVQALNLLRTAVKLHPLILRDLETFYELALWDQPKGYRGDFASSPKPAAVEPKLFALLGGLFAEPTLPEEVHALRPRAIALAYRALGLISYGRRDMPAARRYLGRSLATCPSQLGERGVGTTFARSLLPPRLLLRSQEVT